MTHTRVYPGTVMIHLRHTPVQYSHMTRSHDMVTWHGHMLNLKKQYQSLYRQKKKFRSTQSFEVSNTIFLKWQFFMGNNVQILTPSIFLTPHTPLHLTHPPTSDSPLTLFTVMGTRCFKTLAHCTPLQILFITLTTLCMGQRSTTPLLHY